MRPAAPVRFVCVAGARPNYMKIKPVMDALEAPGRGGRAGPHRAALRPGDERRVLRRARHPAAGPHARRRVGLAGHPDGPRDDSLRAARRRDRPGRRGRGRGRQLYGGLRHGRRQAGALVAHVEAGLRSRDWGMPEEINRVVTDRLSDYLLAPSEDAADNLRAEGYRDDQIQVVGNVMVDTLLANLARAQATDILSRLGLPPGEYGVVTLHRPANVDDPACSGRAAVGALRGRRACARWSSRAPAGRGAAGATPGIPTSPLMPPAGYLDFLALQATARLVLTDSGGVQEETTVLGVPCLTLRDNTERPITVSEGTNRWSAGIRSASSPRRARCWPRRRPRRAARPVGRAAGRADRGDSGRGTSWRLHGQKVRRGESAGATRSDHRNNRQDGLYLGELLAARGMRCSGWSGGSPTRRSRARRGAHPVHPAARGGPA